MSDSQMGARVRALQYKETFTVQDAKQRAQALNAARFSAVKICTRNNGDDTFTVIKI